MLQESWPEVNTVWEHPHYSTAPSSVQSSALPHSSPPSTLWPMHQIRPQLFLCHAAQQCSFSLSYLSLCNPSLCSQLQTQLHFPSCCGHQYMWDTVVDTANNPTTPHHTAANGLVEWLHCTLKVTIMCHADELWTKALPLVLLGICTAYKEDLQSSAAGLIYG